MPVPHYGSFGAVTRVAGARPPHISSSTQPRASLALRSTERVDHDSAEAPEPAQQSTEPFFQRPHPCLHSLSCSFHHSLSPLPLWCSLSSRVSVSPLPQPLIEVAVRAGHQSKLKTGWEKSSKKSQKGRGRSRALFSPGGEKGPCSRLYTLFRKHQGDLEATRAGLAPPSLQQLPAGCPGRGRALHFPTFPWLGQM